MVKPVTPMMKQYFLLKEQAGDALLFFRLGDFYELFFDDAVTASRELELTLTGRDWGQDERAPMCGVPYHAAEGYLTRLIEKGYKVAIAEQTEDPALAKGLVERAITRTVTPGTLGALYSPPDKEAQYLASLVTVGKIAALALCDLSTGDFLADWDQDRQRLVDRLMAFNPLEVLVKDRADWPELTGLYVTEAARHFTPKRAENALTEQFEVAHVEALGLSTKDRAVVTASGALIAYIADTQKMPQKHIVRLRLVGQEGVMPLDRHTRRNLELVEGMQSRSVQGSLFHLLDKADTAMGSRQLRLWVENPLTERAAIEKRLDAVEALILDPLSADRLRGALKQVYDVERLLSRAAYGSLNPREVLAIRRALGQVPAVQAIAETLHNPTITGIVWSMQALPQLSDDIDRAITPDAPLAVGDAPVIQKGYDEKLDVLRLAATEGRQWLIDLEGEERDNTGIKNLKVQYNRVFGYYIEVTKSNLDKVPAHYVRRQTLANCERFTTERLREIERQVLGASDEALKLEIQLFDGVKKRVLDHLTALSDTAQGFKTLDALSALAQAAVQYGYVKPALTDDGALQIEAGRHPMVERRLPEGAFIPNDCALDRDNRRMMILTGPNMSGKSTYMRQTALIVLMAHMGSFVPADSATVPLTDRVMTRIGASDDLAGGQSTFMVEMTELSHILRHATDKSLVILDEIGRGTGTLDGLAIAWATVEYLSAKGLAKTLFATHFHELSELEGVVAGVVNYQVAVREMGDQVLFLHKIIAGGADRSFGVYVARLAGLPKEALARAMEIQARLLASDISQKGLVTTVMEKKKKQPLQLALGESERVMLTDELAALDVTSMTPMEALNRLYLLREKARRLP